jgi:hypothetical protein
MEIVIERRMGRPWTRRRGGPSCATSSSCRLRPAWKRYKDSNKSHQPDCTSFQDAAALSLPFPSPQSRRYPPASMPVSLFVRIDRLVMRKDSFPCLAHNGVFQPPPKKKAQHQDKLAGSHQRKLIIRPIGSVRCTRWKASSCSLTLPGLVLAPGGPFLSFFTNPRWTREEAPARPRQKEKFARRITITKASRSKVLCLTRSGTQVSNPISFLLRRACIIL